MRLAGPWKDATITVATDDELTPEVDLEQSCDTLLLVIPTIETAQVTVEVAEKSGGTFQDLHIVDPVDGGNNKFITASGTGALSVIVPLGGFQFIKVATSAAQTLDRTFRVCGVGV